MDTARGMAAALRAEIALELADSERPEMGWRERRPNRRKRGAELRRAPLRAERLA